MKQRLNIRALFVGAFLLALAVATTGCDTSQGGTVGGNPPEISDTDIHGEFVTLSKLKGKVVILCFWRNSCCSDRLKLMEPVYHQNKDNGLIVLAVNVGDTKESIESYAKKNNLTFTMLADEHGMISKQYGIFGFPTVLLIDRQGVIREKIPGDIPAARLEQLASVYLANTAPQQGSKTPR